MKYFFLFIFPLTLFLWNKYEELSPQFKKQFQEYQNPVLLLFYRQNICEMAFLSYCRCFFIIQDQVFAPGIFDLCPYQMAHYLFILGQWKLI